MGGLGDITVRDIDPLSLYWEPGIRDIQRSRNLFSVGLCDLDALMSAYPFLEGRLDTCTPDIAVHEGEVPVDTTGKVAVVDWYYKKGAARRQGDTALLQIRRRGGAVCDRK